MSVRAPQKRKRSSAEEITRVLVIFDALNASFSARTFNGGRAAVMWQPEIVAAMVRIASDIAARTED